MLNILGLITVNGKQVLEISGVPSTDSGVAAPLGSIAMYDGALYIKIGAASLDWKLIPNEIQVGGLISSAIAPFDARISTEIADRTAADLVLDGRISQEVASRIAYDSELEEMILAETAARSGADALLRSDLEDESSVRASADILLGSRISQEIFDREQAANALGLRIDQEAATRLAADVAIDVRLDVLEGPNTVEGSVAKALFDAKAYTDMETSTRVSEDTRILSESKAYTDMETSTRVSEDIRILSESKAYTDMETSTRVSEDIRILSESKAYTDMETSTRVSEDIRILSESKAYTDMESSLRASEDIRILAESKAYTDMGLDEKADLVHSHVASDITNFASAARFAAVENQIMSGITDVAPSQGAVYSALALKANLSGGNTFSGAQIFDNNVTIHGDLVIDGSLTYVNTQELTVKDPLITLNKGGMGFSAGGAGLEFEEGGMISAYVKVAADRLGYEFLAPASAHKNNLDLSGLSGSHVQKFADTDGTFIMRPSASAGVAGQIPYFSDANNLVSSSGFTYTPADGLVVNGENGSGSYISAAEIYVADVEVTASLSVGGVATFSSTLDVAGVTSLQDLSVNGSGTFNNSLSVSVDVIIGNTLDVAGGTSLQDLSVNGSGTFNNSLSVAGDVSIGSNLLVTGSTSLYGLNVEGDMVANGLATVNALDLTYMGRIYQSAGAAGAHGGREFIGMSEGVTTSDATPVSLGENVTASDSVVTVTSTITGVRVSGSGSAGASACYVRTARFKNIAGVLSQIGSTQTDYTSEDVLGWNAEFGVTGGSYKVMVTGAASTSIRWLASHVTQTTVYV